VNIENISGVIKNASDISPINRRMVLRLISSSTEKTSAVVIKLWICLISYQIMCGLVLPANTRFYRDIARIFIIFGVAIRAVNFFCQIMFAIYAIDNRIVSMAETVYMGMYTCAHVHRRRWMAFAAEKTR